MEYLEKRRWLLKKSLLQRKHIGSFECYAEPDENVIRSALEELRSLHARRAEIVEQYFCLDRNEVRTYAQLAERYHVSSQRISQILDQGIRMLRGILYRDLKLPLFEFVHEIDPEYGTRAEKIVTLEQENEAQKQEIADLKQRIARIVDAGVLSLKSIAEESLTVPISSLHLSVRTYNCLKSMGIETVADLVQYRSKELMRIPHFGVRCLAEIERILEQRGLKLSQK